MMNTVWCWSTCAEKKEQLCPGTYMRLSVCLQDSEHWTPTQHAEAWVQSFCIMVGQLCERHLCPFTPSTHKYAKSPHVSTVSSKVFHSNWPPPTQYRQPNRKPTTSTIFPNVQHSLFDSKQQIVSLAKPVSELRDKFVLDLLCRFHYSKMQVWQNFLLA